MLSAVRAEGKEKYHMHPNKHESFWFTKRVAIATFALALGILVFGGCAVGMPKPGAALPPAPSKEVSRVYQHTYDEVFQASQEAIERMGLFLTGKDKDKGTISGNGVYKWAGKDCTFDIHIEALNTNPETRVTINAKVKGIVVGSEAKLKAEFLAELQQVLSTYH
jgi:hypothetical protein